MTELASTMTPREIASQAAAAISALVDLTADGGELSSPEDVSAILTSLELMGMGMPQLCEQLARFLVAQHEDGQVQHRDGRDQDTTVGAVTEALAAGGQAADMMTAALQEARGAAAELASAR